MLVQILRISSSNLLVGKVFVSYLYSLLVFFIVRLRIVRENISEERKNANTKTR